MSPGPCWFDEHAWRHLLERVGQKQRVHLPMRYDIRGSIAIQGVGNHNNPTRPHVSV